MPAAISPSERLRALLYYLFGAPFILPGAARRLTGFRQAHYGAAMGSWFLLCLVLLALVLAVACLSVVMIFARALYERLHLEPYLLDLVWKAFLAWGVVHIFCAVHAAWGWQGRLPLVSWLGERPMVRATVRTAAAIVLLLATAVAALGFHATTLTRSDERPGKLYMVYEDNGIVPGWVFSLGMYRMASAASEVFGPGETVLLRISHEHLRRAFREGTVVVVGSHGQAQGLISEKRWFTPLDLKAGEVGQQLRYVYLTGCDSGAQGLDWERVLRPAQVATHDRLTAVVEHVWWMWFTGPELLRDIARKDRIKKETAERAAGSSAAQ